MTDSLRQRASAAYLDDDFQSAITFFTQASATPLRTTDFVGRSCQSCHEVLHDTPLRRRGVTQGACFMTLHCVTRRAALSALF